MSVQHLFDTPLHYRGNVALLSTESEHDQQQQTNDVFSDKWGKVDEMSNVDAMYQFQYDWYLKLYGFESEAALADFLKDKKVIFDAGCGLGYKAAWFARLAPHAIVVGMDFSDAVFHAAKNYASVANLFWVKGDIADTHFRAGAVDYVSCDQVIMHTENVEKTFAHLASITSKTGEFACYVYSKKALPRELLDDHFRKATLEIPQEQLWEMSRQLTQVGKMLSDLKIELDFPDMPVLGIKGGKQDLQRWFYWNFIKCFWREDWGQELCDATNYDWYSPSNARRFSEDEYRKLIADEGLAVEFFHKEEACYSGRFSRKG